MSSEVEVDSLRGGSVPSTVAGRERDPDDSSAVAGSEPALLVVALPAHRLLLLALGHPAFPGEAHDVGVAAEDRAMLHGSEHTCCSLRLSVDQKITRREVGVPYGGGRYRYERRSSAEVTGSMSDVTQRQRCIVLALSLSYLGVLQLIKKVCQ